MAISSGQASVGDTATEIVAADATEHRVVLIHDPSGGASVFVGNSSVTTSTGFEVEAGSETPPIPLGAGDALYGVVVTGTQTVSWIAV